MLQKASQEQNRLRKLNQANKKTLAQLITTTKQKGTGWTGIGIKTMDRLGDVEDSHETYTLQSRQDTHTGLYSNLNHE